MVELEQLRVSLTKNGYMKIAEVVKRHPRWEVLDFIDGEYRGVRLVRSQVANIMSQDLDGSLPEFWDEIRSYSDEAIEAFVFVAVVMSHVELIELLKRSSQGDMKGYVQRDELGAKAYTNLVYAMASVGACDYVRGAEAVSYDLRGVVFNLREAGHLVRQLIESKLRRCGWKDTTRFPKGVGTDFFKACRQLELNRVFGLKWTEFRRWLNDSLDIKAPVEDATARLKKTR